MVISPLIFWVCETIGVCQISIFIFPDQTGTATSSPADNTAFETDMNIVNVMLWMKKNAYEESTIDTRSTERYISLFDEQNITWIPVICHNQAEIEQVIKDDDILECQAEGATYFKKQHNCDNDKTIYKI